MDLQHVPPPRVREFLADLLIEREIPATIMACCVLHNICLDHYDPNVEEYCEEGHQYLEAVNELPDFATITGGEGSSSEGISNTRQRIFNDFQQRE